MNEKKKNEEDIFIKGESPNTNELELKKWAVNSWINNLNTYNNILDKILNIIILLFSGVIVFFESLNIYSKNCWWPLPFLLLAISLIISMVGIIPKERKMILSEISEIKKFRNDLIRKKKRCIIFSILFLIMALISVIFIVRGI